MKKSTTKFQYGFTVMREFNSGVFGCLEDTTFNSCDAALSSAYAYYKQHGEVLNIFSLDTESGSITVIYDKAKINHMLDMWQAEDNCMEAGQSFWPSLERRMEA